MEKTIKDLKKGDTVKIVDIDSMIKKYLSEGIFDGIKIERIRLMFCIVENKKYKIIDLCKPCRKITIKVGKSYISIDYKYVNY